MSQDAAHFVIAISLISSDDIIRRVLYNWIACMSMNEKLEGCTEVVYVEGVVTDK